METTENPTIEKTPRVRTYSTARERRAYQRRMTTLAFLRAYPTLGAGMRAAGESWRAVCGMMRCPIFWAECRAIREIQRARRQHRNRPDNRAAVQTMIAAGALSVAARDELRRLHGDDRGACAQPTGRVCAQCGAKSWRPLCRACWGRRKASVAVAEWRCPACGAECRGTSCPCGATQAVVIAGEPLTPIPPSSVDASGLGTAADAVQKIL